VCGEENTEETRGALESKEIEESYVQTKICEGTVLLLWLQESGNDLLCNTGTQLAEQ
jgi:hypothetical protein